MCSFINCTCHQILLELKRKGRWMARSSRVHVTWGMHTGLSEILIHNEKSTPLLGAYMYTKPQTWRYIHCCYRWLNSLSQTVLHSHCSNTGNISTVVMLRLRWCQFNTGSLASGLCSLSLIFFFPPTPQFNICNLGYSLWWLWFEFC
jgi:hypothetical protein